MTITSLKFLGHTLIFILLTLISQIGGIIYFLTLILSKRAKAFNPIYKYFLFVILYLIASFIIVPPLAKKFGRTKIVVNENIKSHHFLTNLLNRNYVKPELNEALLKAATQLKIYDKQLKIKYLDACFPFFDGFNLLPHLSHKDGKKIDLCFFYEDENGILSNKKKSKSGYGVFEKAKKGEIDKMRTCTKLDFKYYDFTKHLTFGKTNINLKLSEPATKKLIAILLEFKETEKIFIEPHLKMRMNIINSKVRYQGCKAVRHDDHIHWQIK